MSKKWDIYSCVFYSWGGEEIPQGDFEIITLTDKTCKLQHISEPFFNFVSRFYGKNKEKKSIPIITLRTQGLMKEFVKEEFVKYDTWCWKPFIFTLKKWK